MRTLPPGTAIGPYVVESEIARGAMGAVYRARRSQDGAVVALKVLSAGPVATESQVERFRREGELAARLAHPGIVRVLDAGTSSWLSYIAMDLIEGEPLSASAGRLAPLEAARLIAQVARAVEHAHAHGVVHRDLKPGNVLVRRHDGRALVTDFGIARDLAASALTKTGAMVGTPTYFSPEQAAGRPVTAASDVHALGVLLFEAVTGLPPFRHGTLPAMLVAISDEVPEPPSALTKGVPPELDRVCRAALRKAPDARPTAGEVADALEALVEGRAAPRAAWRPRRLALALGAIALALTAAALALVNAPATSDAAAPRPSASRTTRPVRPPPEPAWVEPTWLRALAARRDTPCLMDALRALDAAPAVDARTRARAVEVLAAMDARWTEPRTGGPEVADALDHLLWLHWLWKRVDPSYQLSSPRQRLFDARIPWALGLQREADYAARVGRAGVALTPGSVTGYLIYATSSSGERSEVRDGELMRRGVELAAAKKDAGAWGTIVTRYLGWLSASTRVEGPERVAAARAALFELCRRVNGVEGELDPTVAADVLIRGAEYELGGVAQADAHLLRAEALIGPSAYVSHVRATLLSNRATGPDSVVAAALEADRALELLAAEMRTKKPQEKAVTEVTDLAYRLWSRAGRPPRALAALERGLALDGRRPGLAARRLVLLLDDATTPADVLSAALQDLVTRLEAELEARRDPTFLGDALAVARAAAAAGTPVQPAFEAALRKLGEGAALAALDGL